MANRYAVANGNWSNPATWNGGTLPTLTDFVAANNFTVTVDVDINVGRLTTAAQAPAVAGGGFTVSTTRTVTLTDTLAVVPGTTTCITYSGAAGTVFTLNCGATGQLVKSSSAVACVLVSSNGTMNATGVIPFTAAAVANVGINITGANSNVTFTGNVFAGGNTSRGISTTVSCTLTVIGNVESGTGNDGYGIVFSGGTLNITGNLTMNNSAANRCSALFNGGTAYITGNITGWGGTGGAQTCPTVQVGAATAALYVTGTVTGGAHLTNSAADAIRVANASAGTANVGYVNIVGPIVAGYVSPGLIAVSLGTINILSGPFVCSTYGTFPLSISRMHYIVTPTSYFEFRNSSTNGAVPPGPIAPAARMYDPSFISGAPTANNVRSGVVYASGSQTGTLVVPAASSVAAGVVFDNGTIGTAVLTQAAVSAAVWNELVANLTTANSIGLRMSSCSTVATTGAQITSLT